MAAQAAETRAGGACGLRADDRARDSRAATAIEPQPLELNVMNDACDNPGWGNAKRRSFTPQRRGEYQQDREALVDAIEDRDTETAVAVMGDHLSRIRVTLLGH
ncbi:MAG: FCD domain-containing protein [Acidimicrobiales bacterium]